MKRLKLKILLVLPAALLIPVGALAQPANDCELHVFPTQNYNAYFNGVVGGYGGYMEIGLTPMDQVAHRLALAIDPAAQVERIRALELGSSQRFSGYQVVFHDPLRGEPFATADVRNIGRGLRMTDSQATCYAELHVMGIALIRTAISKDIQSMFLFREFGAGQEPTLRFFDADGNGAPGFDTGAEVDTDEARESVQQAFVESLRAFLGKRRMRVRG